jgi:hypothetical protein
MNTISISLNFILISTYHACEKSGCQSLSVALCHGHFPVDIWSVRIARGYRAIGIFDGDTVTWFWIVVEYIPAIVSEESWYPVHTQVQVVPGALALKHLEIEIQFLDIKKRQVVRGESGFVRFGRIERRLAPCAGESLNLWIPDTGALKSTARCPGTFAPRRARAVRCR